MTNEQKAKYEEAAKARANVEVGPEETMIPETRTFYDSCVQDFMAGATFAHNEAEGFIQILKKLIEEKDEQMALQHEIHKNAEKAAHNEAIDAALAVLQKHYDFHFMVGNIVILNGELEKLKL